jgi:hypothetical protein
VKVGVAACSAEAREGEDASVCWVKAPTARTNKRNKEASVQGAVIRAKGFD